MFNTRKYGSLIYNEVPIVEGNPVPVSASAVSSGVGTIRKSGSIVVSASVTTSGISKKLTKGSTTASGIASTVVKSVKNSNGTTNLTITCASSSSSFVKKGGSSSSQVGLSASGIPFRKSNGLSAAGNVLSAEAKGSKTLTGQTVVSSDTTIAVSGNKLTSGNGNLNADVSGEAQNGLIKRSSSSFVNGTVSSEGSASKTSVGKSPIIERFPYNAGLFGGSLYNPSPINEDSTGHPEIIVEAAAHGNNYKFSDSALFVDIAAISNGVVVQTGKVNASISSLTNGDRVVYKINSATADTSINANAQAVNRVSGKSPATEHFTYNFGLFGSSFYNKDPIYGTDITSSVLATSIGLFKLKAGIANITIIGEANSHSSVISLSKAELSNITATYQASSLIRKLGLSIVDITAISYGTGFRRIYEQSDISVDVIALSVPFVFTWDDVINRIIGWDLKGVPFSEWDLVSVQVKEWLERNNTNKTWEEIIASYSSWQTLTGSENTWEVSKQNSSEWMDKRKVHFEWQSVNQSNKDWSVKNAKTSIG
jgi:hypothetical protein